METTTLTPTPKHALSAKQKARINESREAFIKADVEYNVAIHNMQTGRIKIDTDDKKSALKYLLGEALDACELSFEVSAYIANFGDYAKKPEITFGEFHALQEIIKHLKIRGYDNHIKLYNAMKAFNEDGILVQDSIVATNKLSEEYNKKHAAFVKECQHCGASIDLKEIQDEVEKRIDKEIASRSTPPDTNTKKTKESKNKE